MIAAVGLTLILPVAGLIVSLAAITLLRAADQAQSALAVRRSVRGPRASDLLVVVVTAPLSVVRALLTEALMAPLALIVGAMVYVATLALTHGLELPRAGSYAAAAVVAWYGIGPGSGRPRQAAEPDGGRAGADPADRRGDRAGRVGAGRRRHHLRRVAGPVLLAGAEPAPAHTARLAVHRLAPAPAARRAAPAQGGSAAARGLLSSARDWLLRHSHA